MLDTGLFNKHSHQVNVADWSPDMYRPGWFVSEGR